MTPEDLRAWRARHHLTQTRLATYLNVSVLTIKRWESGFQATPSFLHLALQRIEQLLARPRKAPVK